MRNGASLKTKTIELKGATVIKVLLYHLKICCSSNEGSDKKPGESQTTEKIYGIFRYILAFVFSNCVTESTITTIRLLITV